jgi:hypothetical protein
MSIHRVYSPVLSRILLALFVSSLLAACNTEENYGVSGGSGTAGGGIVQGAAISLSWNAPYEREDGTPIAMSEIAGYRVYYGMSQGSYTEEVDVKDGSTMEVTLDGVASGTYYIVVTTYDVDGRESGYSDEVVKTI